MTELPLALKLAIGLSVPVLWLATGALSRHIAGMSRVVLAVTGPPLRRSRWGDGVVNGVRFGNCLRVVEFGGGWVLEGRRILGGGRLWLPRADTRVGPLQDAGRAAGGPSRLLEWGENRVELKGALAHFVDESRAARDAASE